jgi:hypothetical protein
MPSSWCMRREFHGTIATVSRCLLGAGRGSSWGLGTLVPITLTAADD